MTAKQKQAIESLQKITDNKLKFDSILFSRGGGSSSIFVFPDGYSLVFRNLLDSYPTLFDPKGEENGISIADGSYSDTLHYVQNRIGEQERDEFIVVFLKFFLRIYRTKAIG